MDILDVALLIVAIVCELLGPVILLALLAWGIWLLYRGLRLRKSLKASWDNEHALSLEKIRFKVWGITLLGLVCAVFVFLQLTWNSGRIDVAFIVALVIAALFRGWAKSLKRRYNADFKNSFVAVELAKVFDNLSYAPDGTIDTAEIKDLHFFSHFTRMSSNDRIEADYKNRHFLQGDIHLLERRMVSTRDAAGREVKRVQQREVFNGKVLRFDFAAPFRGAVQVVKRDFSPARVLASQGTWQPVETELAEFGEDYLVFAQDPLDAMAVLTPQMIEGLYYLNRKIREPMAFYFKGQSMYAFIALARDPFETSKKRTLLEEQELLREDIGLITGFLETMYVKKHQPEAAAELAAGTTVEISPEEARQALLERAALDAVPQVRDSVVRMGYKLTGAMRIVGGLIALAPLIAYALSIIYLLAHFPADYDYALSYSSSGDGVSVSEGGLRAPLYGYLIVASIFIIPTTLAGGNALGVAFSELFTGGGSGISFSRRLGALIRGGISMVVALIPFWIHLLFITANMSSR